jgi:hypothetical protein
MKKIIILVLILTLSIPVIALAERVRGYWRDNNGDGQKEYVQPYQRTPPDSRRDNNYNFPGNYNPNNGRITPGDPNNYDHPKKGRPY